MSGSGDLLLSDARRPGSCPGLLRSGKRRRGLGWAGPEAPYLGLGPPRRGLTPEAGVLGSSADAAGDCGTRLRYLFWREAPQPYSFLFSPPTDAGESACPAAAFPVLCTSCSHFSASPSSRFSVGSA